MTDEEMADQFANNGYALGCTITPFESAKEGFLAGLKAGRPKRHKVADGDLPEEGKKVLLYAKDKDCYMGYLENGAWHYEGGFYACPDFVVAWSELLPFEEE